MDRIPKKKKIFLFLIKLTLRAHNTKALNNDTNKTKIAIFACASVRFEGREGIEWIEKNTQFQFNF